MLNFIGGFIIGFFAGMVLRRYVQYKEQEVEDDSS